MELPPIVTPWYLDKALWLTILTPICLLISAKLGLELKAEEIVGLMLPVAAYVLAHKWKTAKLHAALIAKAAANDITDSAKAAQALRAG